MKVINMRLPPSKGVAVFQEIRLMKERFPIIALWIAIVLISVNPHVCIAVENSSVNNLGGSSVPVSSSATPVGASVPIVSTLAPTQVPVVNVTTQKTIPVSIVTTKTLMTGASNVNILGSTIPQPSSSKWTPVTNGNHQQANPLPGSHVSLAALPAPIPLTMTSSVHAPALPPTTLPRPLPSVPVSTNSKSSSPANITTVVMTNTSVSNQSDLNRQQNWGRHGFPLNRVNTASGSQSVLNHVNTSTVSSAAWTTGNGSDDGEDADGHTFRGHPKGGDDSGRNGEQDGLFGRNGDVDRPFLEVRGETAQLIALSRLKLGSRCADRDSRKESLAEVMRWSVERVNGGSPKYGISVYDTCGMRDDSAVTVAMAAIAREARLRVRSQASISSFPLGFIIEEDDEDLLSPLLTSLGFPYVTALDWDMVETLRGAAHLLMTWGRFPPIILLTQDPRALPVFADAANSYALCLRAAILFPHVDDCRLRNPLDELKAYYAIDDASRGSSSFLEDQHSSVWVIHGSEAFVARCASKYWGVVPASDVSNLVIAAKHPITGSPHQEFIPVVKMVQTTGPMFPELNQTFIKISGHQSSSDPSTSTQPDPFVLTSSFVPTNPAWMPKDSWGNNATPPIPSSAGNDIATTVSLTIAALRKLEGAGKHHCWEQRAEADLESTVRASFPPIESHQNDGHDTPSRPGFVIGSPLMRKKATSIATPHAVIAKAECRKYLDATKRLDPKLYDVADRTSMSQTEKNSTHRFNFQPAKYRFSVLRKKQGVTEWDRFAQYSSRDLTLFGEKVQYILGLPSWNTPHFTDPDTTKTGCLNYELQNEGFANFSADSFSYHAPLAVTEASWSIACLVITVLGILGCAFLIIFFYYRLCIRGRSEPHYGYPLILLFSIMCLFASVIPFIMEANDVVCKFRMFAAGIGYAFPFSAMLARQAMIATATSNSGSDHISGVVQLMLCAFSFGIQCCVGVETWLLKPSGLVWVWSPDKGRVPKCHQEPGEILVSSIYVAFLLICLLLVGPVAAKKKRNFKEGLHLCIVSWVVAGVWVGWCTLLTQYPDWTRLIISGGMLVSATMILVGVFLPKICFLMTHTLSFRKNGSTSPAKATNGHTKRRDDKYREDLGIPEDGTNPGELIHATNLAVLNRAFSPGSDGDHNGSSAYPTRSSSAAGSRGMRHLSRADSCETSGTILSASTTRISSVPTRIAELDAAELAAYGYGAAMEDDPPVRSEHLRRAEQSDRQNSVSVGRVLKI